MKTENINTAKLLKELVSIESFSGSESRMCDAVFSFLKKHRISSSKMQVDKGGYNIIAKVGTPKIYFISHMDTVKPFIKPKETKDKIFGRGACDTKGSIAAILSAAAECKKEGISGFGMIFTVGEEVDFRGIKKVANAKVDVKFAIIGEPTQLKIINGHYGIMVVKLVSKGKKAHSSAPEKGDNALVKMLDCIESIRKNLKLGNKSLMTIAQLNSGIADNVIPDFAEAKISLRIHPADNKDYFAEVKRIAKDKAAVEKTLFLKGLHNEVPAELDFITEKKIVRYCTELSIIKKGIVLGPGNPDFAHTDNEQISKKELVEGKEAYKRIIERFCGNRQ